MSFLHLRGSVYASLVSIDPCVTRRARAFLLRTSLPWVEGLKRKASLPMEQSYGISKRECLWSSSFLRLSLCVLELLSLSLWFWRRRASERGRSRRRRVFFCVSFLLQGMERKKGESFQVVLSQVGQTALERRRSSFRTRATRSGT